MKRKLIYAIVGLLIVSACREDNIPEPIEYGYLSMQIALNITSEEASGRIDAVDTDDFRVTIFDASGTEIMVFDPFSSAPAEVALPTGEYYVEAHSNNLVDAAFENPYYFGRSANFTIDKEETTAIDIDTELANTKVAILYSAEVVNTFTSYTGTVTVISNGSSLFYDQGETREGYFITSPLEVEVELSYTKLDGSTIDRVYTATIDDPQPKTLYNINVDAALEDGVIVFNIIVDESFDTIDIDLGDSGSGPNGGWQPGDDWIDERDGNSYGTVQIGTQVWMTENLKYLPEVNTYSEFNSANLFFEEAYAVYGYNGNSVTDAKSNPNFDTYGALYNWWAVMQGESSSASVPSGVQGVCPANWHVPSSMEWSQLRSTVGTGSADKLKETGTSTWQAPNTNATNEFGFNGQGSGNRIPFTTTGSDTQLQVEAYFWSSEAAGNSARFWALRQSSDMTGGSTTDKRYGISVRCIKD